MFDADEAAMFDEPAAKPRAGGRRGDDPFQPTPGAMNGLQSTGVTGSLLGLPFDPATQGVTGRHGETGDPMAREIETGLVTGGAGALAGKALGAAAPAIGRAAGKLGELAPKAVETIKNVVHFAHNPVGTIATKIAEAAKVAGGAAAKPEVWERFAPAVTADEAAAAITAATSGGGTSVGTATMNLIRSGVPRAAALAGAKKASEAPKP
jgi:hypothetical protein